MARGGKMTLLIANQQTPDTYGKTTTRTHALTHLQLQICHKVCVYVYKQR